MRTHNDRYIMMCRCARFHRSFHDEARRMLLCDICMFFSLCMLGCVFVRSSGRALFERFRRKRCIISNVIVWREQWHFVRCIRSGAFLITQRLGIWTASNASVLFLVVCILNTNHEHVSCENRQYLWNSSKYSRFRHMFTIFSLIHISSWRFCQVNSFESCHRIFHLIPIELSIRILTCSCIRISECGSLAFRVYFFKVSCIRTRSTLRPDGSECCDRNYQSLFHIRYYIQSYPKYTFSRELPIVAAHRTRRIECVIILRSMFLLSAKIRRNQCRRAWYATFVTRWEKRCRLRRCSDDE